MSSCRTLGVFRPSGPVQPIVRLVPLHAIPRTARGRAVHGLGFSWGGAQKFGQSAGGAVGGVVASSVGAASGIAAGAIAGSVVPVIGTVIGAAIGALAGGLFGHADHAQIARDVQGRKDIFGQYANVVGTVPGRTIGLANMRQIWKGAAHLGHFPGWKGEEQRIDSAIDGCRRCDPNTMNILWPKAKAAGVRNALDFYNNYFVPANQQMGDRWATNTDALGTQVTIDTIDAYLSEQDPTTTPYVSNPQAAAAQPAVTPAQQVAAQPAPAQSTVAPAAPAPLPAPAAVPIPAGFSAVGPDAMGGSLVYQGPDGRLYTWNGTQMLPFSGPILIKGQLTSFANGVPQAPVTGPLQYGGAPSGPTPQYAQLDPATMQAIQAMLAQGASPQQTYQAAVNSGVPPAAAAGAVQAAGVGAGLPAWATWAGVGLGVIMLGFALARPRGAPRSRARFA